MKKIVKYLAPLLVVAALPMVASAELFLNSIDLTGSLNRVDTLSRSVFVTSGGSQVDASVVVEGDFLVSIFSATQLYVGGSDTPVWTASAGDYLLGYSLMEVQHVYTDVNTSALVGMDFRSPSGNDPLNNNVLNAGGTVKLFTSATNWTVSSGTLDDSIASVTQGLGLATFDLMASEDFSSLGVSYITIANTQIPVLRVAAFGLTAIDGPDGITFVPGDAGFDTENELSGIASILIDTSAGPWDFTGSGPLFFSAVPEPGSLTLLAGCLAIGGVLALRRRKK